MFFWQDMVELHTGAMDSPAILYNVFREMVEFDLRESERVQEGGTLNLLLEILPYCFKGTQGVAPPSV